MSEQTYSISELAAEFGVTPRTIRHYEEQGLLSPGREGLLRVYSKRDRTRLKLTLRGKRLGLALADIRYLMDLYHTAPDESSQLEKFLVVLAERRAALEQQRRDLEEVLGEVVAFEDQCRQILESRASTKTSKA
ncbi:MAG: MerR family DNA-binding transcriptional regulator [Rhodocyclaceae bacterium]|nr:MerR family DNA-binding transcriptional regulator [Rhodocyclaceae bacterium]